MLRIRKSVLLLIILLMGIVPVMAQETLTLTQTFTSADKQVTLNYPADWDLKEDPSNPDNGEILSLNLATDQDLLEQDPLSKGDVVFDAGNIRLNIVLFTRTSFAGMTIPPDVSVEEVLKELVNDEHSTNAKITFSTVSPTTVAGYPAVTVDASNPEHGASTVWLVDYGTAIAGVALYTAPDELEQWVPTALAIAESMKYVGANLPEVTPAPEETAIPTAQPVTGTALDLTETYSNEAGTISFQYPADWLTQDHSFDESFSVTTASTDDALRMNLGNQNDVFAPGDVQIQVLIGTTDSIAGDIPGLKATDTAIDFLKALIEAAKLAPANLPFTFGEIETTSINDRLVGRLELKDSDQGQSLILVMRIKEGMFAAIAVTTAPDELAKFEPTARAMLASVSLTADALAIETPEPVATETVESTPVPTEVALTETFTNKNGAGTFQYPAGFLVDDQSGSDDLSVVLATSENIFNHDLSDENGTYLPGDVQLQLIAGSTKAITSDTPFPTDGSADPVDFLTSLIDAAKGSGQQTGFTFGEVTPDSINDLKAARAEVDAGKKGQAVLMIVSIEPDALAVVILSTASGELEKWEPVAREIVSSLKFTDISPEETPVAEATADVTPEATDVVEVTPEAVLAQTFTTGNNQTTLSFPDGWVTRTLGGYGVYVANNAAALNHTLGGKFASGEVQILVAVDTIGNLTPQLNLGLEPEASALKFLQAIIKAYKVLGTFETPVETQVGDFPAASAYLHGNGYDVKSVVVQFADNSIGVIQLTTAPGELDQWESTLDAVLNSIQYTP